MGNPHEKKERERRHLDRFAAACPDFPIGLIEESEEPDFIIHTTEGDLGIELTEVVLDAAGLGFHPRARESHEDRILREARKLYEGREAKARIVSVHFSTEPPATKDRIMPIVRDLVALVSAAPEDGLDFENPWDDSFAEEIESVMVRGGVERGLWYTTRGGFYAERDVAQIQQMIDAKGAKLPRYRECCTRAWLVIVVDGFAPSSFVDLASQAVTHEYSTEFDRVYYFENFDHRAVRLHPRG